MRLLIDCLVFIRSLYLARSRDAFSSPTSNWRFEKFLLNPSPHHSRINQQLDLHYVPKAGRTTTHQIKLVAVRFSLKSISIQSKCRCVLEMMMELTQLSQNDAHQILKCSSMVGSSKMVMLKFTSSLATKSNGALQLYIEPVEIRMAK